MSEEQTAAAPQARPEETADDANYQRGLDFRRLLGRPLTWLATLALVLAVGVAATIWLGAAIGAAAAAAALGISLLIVFVIADRRSERAFFPVYASERDMVLSGHGEVRAATPLLCRGNRRYAVRSFSGPFAEDLDGLLALYTYEETSGNNQQSAHRYTIGLVEVPECTEVPELLCLHRSGLNLLEGLGGALDKSRQRVRLESEALNEHYEILCLRQQDQVWLRRLFSPSFVVWLAEEAPKKFAFELVEGRLCCYVKGHKKSAAELDAIRAATAKVARRLRDEAGETS